MRLPQTFDPKRNRPTVGNALTMFVGSLWLWAMQAVPDTVPSEVVFSGYTLGAILIVVGVGQLVQRVGKHAPWAADAHYKDVQRALREDPGKLIEVGGDAEFLPDDWPEH